MTEPAGVEERSTPLYRAWHGLLDPAHRQRSMLGRYAGAARFAYNFGIRRCAEEREAGRKRPTAFTLQKEIVALKSGDLPWLREVSKCCAESGLRDLEAAWSAFFGKRARYPKPRRRRDGGHFALTGVVRVEGGAIQLPRIGRIRLGPRDRRYVPDGEYKTAKLTERGGRWYVSVDREAVEPAPPNGGPVVAVDRGVRKLGVTSDGEVIANPRAEERAAKHIRRAQLSVARKQRATDKRHGKREKGECREASKRLRRAYRQLARAKERAANVRRDALHQASKRLATTASVVVLEDLRVQNMTRHRKGKGRAAKAGLNRAILNVGWGEFKRQLGYKCRWYGSRLVLVNPAYSSQDCSTCGARNDPGSAETYRCAACGLVLDRDENAARNLLHRYAAGNVIPDAASGCGAKMRGEPSTRPAGLGPGRQEATIREGSCDARASK